ncbi:hypothetical protein ACFY3V_02810 [Streptosporangium sp. NPDC000095]|uniref:hypothetical protein n=1 Tax=Streptosporangium sp. NPDC000095 TaxID=3366184 RepID=UPI003696FE6C
MIAETRTAGTRVAETGTIGPHPTGAKSVETRTFSTKSIKIGAARTTEDVASGTTSARITESVDVGAAGTTESVAVRTTPTRPTESIEAGTAGTTESVAAGTTSARITESVDVGAAPAGTAEGVAVRTDAAVTAEGVEAGTVIGTGNGTRAAEAPIAATWGAEGGVAVRAVGAVRGAGGAGVRFAGTAGVTSGRGVRTPRWGEGVIGAGRGPRRVRRVVRPSWRPLRYGRLTLPRVHPHRHIPVFLASARGEPTDRCGEPVTPHVTTPFGKPNVGDC